MKKTIMILIFLTATVVILVVFFRINSQTKLSQTNKITKFEDITEIPDTTGGTVPQAIESDVKEGQATNKLIKLLPFSEKVFTITDYNYKIAKFSVNFNDQASASPEADFLNWLETSEYSDIPEERFLLNP
ncbi:MAG TPA: hypothetical protein VJ227_03755 [Patescibacteria group bacterium]|nr:hypothetical protein [Patescibacteria group bacterium]